MTTINKNQSAKNQLYWVADNVIEDDFPEANSALRDPDGLLAIGGDLSHHRLLDAYRRGIFPWYSQGQPILWWSPDPRCVLDPNELIISRNLKKTLKKNIFNVTFNQAFDHVIKGCAQPRKGSADTWITTDIIQSYTSLHQEGHAISVECWLNSELVGGLYGIVIDRIYFGESMFSRATDASKIALVHLVQELKARNFRLIDCQIFSKHLKSLGAKPVPRNFFISALKHYCNQTVIYDWPVNSPLK